MIYETPIGVLGNKGTCPFTFREQGNMTKYFQGTREHGIYFGEQGNMESLLGNRGTCFTFGEHFLKFPIFL
jgi:hypothetical protein